MIYTIKISVSDPDSIGSVEPDPDSDWESGSGSRGQKLPHKERKKCRNIMFLSAECSLWETGGFSCRF
jgi:hypothetical protein